MERIPLIKKRGVFGENVFLGKAVFERKEIFVSKCLEEAGK